MRKSDSNQDKNVQSSSAKDHQAFQSALEEAEQALEGDPLQQDVQQNKGKQG